MTLESEPKALKRLLQILVRCMLSLVFNSVPPPLSWPPKIINAGTFGLSGVNGAWGTELSGQITYKPALLLFGNEQVKGKRAQESRGGSRFCNINGVGRGE